MANFYKCGDDLPAPYYLSWNKIIAPKPDFHYPDFFWGNNICLKGMLKKAHFEFRQLLVGTIVQYPKMKLFRLKVFSFSINRSF